jgi:osmotically-inducible protein OsmY
MNDASHPAGFQSDDVPAPGEDSPANQPAGQSSENRELADSVREKLASTGYHQLLRIDVAAEGSNVRLSGRVGRYYLLQVAQQAAMEAEGVSELKNDLQVVRTPSGR